MQSAYLPANRKMADVSELRAVRGVTPKIYARIKPWICALPVTDPVKLNVNTLAPEQAPLVAMLLPGEITTAEARAAARRPDPAWWSRRSEEHTSELQSLMRNSYAVFCLKKKKQHKKSIKQRKNINDKRSANSQT